MSELNLQTAMDIIEKSLDEACEFDAEKYNAEAERVNAFLRWVDENYDDLQGYVLKSLLIKGYV